MAIALQIPYARLPWVFSFLLGLGLAYGAAGWIGDEEVRPRQTVTSQTGRAEVKETTSAGIIVEKNILGLEVPKKEVKKEEPPPPPKKGPDPNEWVVSGLVVGKKSMVIVTVEKETHYVMPNDVLKGWTLQHLRPQEAVWVNGGERRITALKRKDDAGAKIADAAKIQRTITPPTPPRDPGEEPARTVNSKIRLSRKDVQPVLKDPTMLLKEANFKPYTKDGKVHGFKLTHIKSDSMLKKVGLRSGDVLMRINGADVDGPRALLDAYSELDRADSVTLDALRRGKIVSILVELR